MIMNVYIRKTNGLDKKFATTSNFQYNLDTNTI